MSRQSIRRSIVAIFTGCLALLMLHCSEAELSADEEEYCFKEADISLGQWREFSRSVDTLRCRLFFMADTLQPQDTLAFRVSQSYLGHDERIIGTEPIHVNLSSEHEDAERFSLISKWEPCETRIGDLEVFRAIIPKEISTDIRPHDGVLGIHPDGETISGRYVSHCTGDTLQTQIVISGAGESKKTDQ